MNSSCKMDDNFFLQMIRINYPDWPASCKEDGRVVEYFMQFLGRKRMLIMLLIVGFNYLIVGAVLGRRGRRKGSRGGRTRPARPSYLVRQIQILLVFIFSETITNIFDIFTW